MPQAVKGMAVVIDSEVDADLVELLAEFRAVGIQPLAVSDGPLADSRPRRWDCRWCRSDSGKVAAAPAGSARTGSRSCGRASDQRRWPARKPAKDRLGAGALRPAGLRRGLRPHRAEHRQPGSRGDRRRLHSHVYGKLAGRALAGAKGDESARVFCRKLDAELIAIAGIYAVAEQIKAGPVNEPALAWLEDGRLKIEAHKI